MNPSSVKKALAFGGAVIVLLALVFGARNIRDRIFGDEYRRLEVVRIGMSEKEVIDLLGEPHKIYHRDSAPKDYYVPGYAHKERAITNKVLIYSFGEPIAYYYIDKSSKVEDIFIGGS